MTDEILKNATARLANSIKNPLASIMLQTKLIKKVRPELEDEVNIINDECRRISTLLSTMEMFTEDPVGKKIDIDLILFINDVISRHTDISVNFNTNLKKVMISFDNNKLRYILDSIIQNSIDACQKTDEACIKIGVHSLCSNKIEINISDNGVGFKGNIKSIFDMFYSTKTNNMGFGLALSKRFVEANGGEITLEDGIKRGAVCRIIIPAKEVI